MKIGRVEIVGGPNIQAIAILLLGYALGGWKLALGFFVFILVTGLLGLALMRYNEREEANEAQ